MFVSVPRGPTVVSRDAKMSKRQSLHHRAYNEAEGRYRYKQFEYVVKPQEMCREEGVIILGAGGQHGELLVILKLRATWVVR